MEKRSTWKWMDKYNIQGGHDILDPDGWNRDKLVESLQEEITLEEFKVRICQSTCRMRAEKVGDKINMYVGDLKIASADKA